MKYHLTSNKLNLNNYINIGLRKCCSKKSIIWNVINFIAMFVLIELMFISCYLCGFHKLIYFCLLFGCPRFLKYIFFIYLNFRPSFPPPTPALQATSAYLNPPSPFSSQLCRCTTHWGVLCKQPSAILALLPQT